MGDRDLRNAHGGLKPLLERLVAHGALNPNCLGLIADDSPRSMPDAPRMSQFSAKKGAGYAVVRIYSIDQLAAGDGDAARNLA